MARQRSNVGKVLETMKGMVPQALRPEYAGEDKKYGWRADLAPRDQGKKESDADYAEYLRRFNDPARRQAQRDGQQIVTKYYNDAEREASKVGFDAQGRAVGKTASNPDGTMTGPDGIIKDKKIEYVADAQGALYQFKPDVRPTGEKMTSPITDKQVNKNEATHHSSVLAGEAVAAAGEIKLDYQGYVRQITNKSGHYKPGATQVIQLLEELARQGALLDRTYLMPDAQGKGQKLEGKPLEIFQAIERVEAGLDKKLSEGKSIDPDLAAIKKGKEALDKLGAGPANKFRDAQVKFVEGAGGKTGAEVRTTKGTKSTAEDFLRSGGGATTKVTRTEAVEDHPAGPMPSTFGATNIDYDTYPPETIAARLGLDVADVKAAEFEGMLYPDDLLKNSDLKKKMGVNSLEEIHAKLNASGGPRTRTVTTHEKVGDLKDKLLGELKTGNAAPGKARPKTLQDAESQQRADDMPAKLKASMERLPKVLAWYHAEMKKAESDQGAGSEQRRKDLADGIARVEAAMNPTDVSEKALAKVLSDLEAQFVRIQRAPQGAPPAWDKSFEVMKLRFDAWPVDFFVQKLGWTAEDVEDAADEDGIFPCDLFNDDYFSEKLEGIGVNTLKDLYEKLFG
jgi:hypothetical protein